MIRFFLSSHIATLRSFDMIFDKAKHINFSTGMIDGFETLYDIQLYRAIQIFARREAVKVMAVCLPSLSFL